MNTTQAKTLAPKMHQAIDVSHQLPTAKQGTRLRIKSSALFGQARELLIEHSGNEYLLQITGQDKLLLTK
ncbi:MAG: hemin uptake protein HemP [Methylophilaceae bacterium]